MHEEDLTEPAATPPGGRRHVPEIALILVTLGLIGYRLWTGPGKPPKTDVPLGHLTGEVEPAAPPEAAPTSLPVVVLEPTPLPREIEEKSPEKVPTTDRRLETLRATYRTFTPSAFARIRADLLAERKKRGEREDLGLMIADVHAYLGRRQKNQAWISTARSTAAGWSRAHPKDARAVRARALASWAAGDVKRDAALARKAAAENPSDPIARFLDASALAATGRPDEGIAGLKETCARYPECFPCTEALAELYVGRGQYAEAEPLIQRLLAAEPADLPADRMLAEALEGQGKWKELIDRYEPIASKDRSRSDLKLLLFQAYRREGRFVDASRHLNDLIAAQEAGTLQIPKNRQALYYLERGKLEFDQGKFARSLPHFRKVLDQEPNHPQALKYLAGALYREKQFKESALVYERAVKADPSDVATRQYYAMALLDLRQPDKAREVLEDVVKRGAESAPVYFHLARAHEMKGELAQAQEMAERALKLDPAFAPARNLLAKLQAKKL